MVKINAPLGGFYNPPNFKGLEEIVLFFKGYYKGRSLPNSVTWVFDGSTNLYQPEILANDVGCGASVFIVEEIEPKETAEIFCDYLKGKNILGRGNHFIDICGPITSPHTENSPHNVLLIHSDFKKEGAKIPTSFREVKNREKEAKESRISLGYKLSELVGINAEFLGDWPHNTVEVGDKIVYRKGTIKTEKEKLHIIYANLGEKILFYTLDSRIPNLYDSLPHGTGRSGSRSETKILESDANSVRNLVYIPPTISDASLRTEHPSCYNNFDNFFELISKKEQIQLIGEMEILSYLGKI